MVFETFFVLLAGLGAGIITGLFGASAVNFAVPILVIFLGYNPYMAIGLSLGIDFFASISSSIEYHSKRKIRYKPALILIIASLIGVVLGSYYSTYIPSIGHQWILGLAIFITGIILAIKKGNFNLKKPIIFKKYSRMYKTTICIILGLLVGLNAGIFGAGGGLAIFSILVIFLGYKIHNSIATSIFSMIFIAFIGAIIHYLIMPFSLYHLALGAIAGIIGSYFSAFIANKTSGKKIALITGIIISIMGALMFLKDILY